MHACLDNFPHISFLSKLQAWRSVKCLQFSLRDGHFATVRALYVTRLSLVLIPKLVCATKTTSLD